MRFAAIALRIALRSALAGCSTSEPAPRERAARADRRRARRSSSGRCSPADYMATRLVDRPVSKSARRELALTRAAEPRGCAISPRTMIAGHKGISAQMSFAGRRLNLLPSATMLPRHQAMLDELRRAAISTRPTAASRSPSTRRRCKLHGDFAARGESPTLRAVAATPLPIDAPAPGRDAADVMRALAC